MTINWNTSVYAQERNILHVSNLSATAAYVRLLIIQPSGFAGAVIKYAIPAARELDIDMSDLVRLSTSGQFTLGEYTSGDVIIGTTYTCTWTVAGRINPAAAIIPKPGVVCMYTPTYGDWADFRITPPSKIIRNTNLSLQLEVYTDAVSHTYAYSAYRGAVWSTAATLSGLQTIVLLNNTAALRLLDDAAGTAPDPWETLAQIDFESQNPERDYVLIRWVSRFGGTKQLMWERRNVKEATADALELDSLQNQYETRKGIVESFTAYLDDLDAYDFWYYADIVTSSKVEVLHGGAWISVDVENKEYQIPNTSAGALEKLEINIKFRKYDTL